MYPEKCLALVFSVMILGQAYFIRRHIGTWLCPACIFGLFWFAYTFVPLTVLFWVPVNVLAIAFVFLCTLAFSMGSLFFDWKTAFVRNGQKRKTQTRAYGNSFLKRVFYLSTLLSLAFLALNLFDQGFSLHDLLFDLYATAGTYTDLRYSESLSGNIYNPLSIVSAYLGVIIGGLLFLSAPTKGGRRLIIVLSFLPSILVMVTQSAKGLLFLSIVFFYAGQLVYRASGGSLRLFGTGSIKSLVLCAVILAPIVTISFLSRGLYKIDDSSKIIEEMIRQYASYSCSFIYAFSDWFSFIIGTHSELAYHHESATHGFYTFAPLFKVLGSHRELTLTIFDEFYSYGDLLTGNIFTMFRGLIQDFGFIGSVVFMILAGLLLHWNFHQMLLKKTPVFTVAVFIFMMGYFYMSFGVSLLIWSSMYVAFVLIWLVLQTNKLIMLRDSRWLARSELCTGAAPCSES